MMRGVLMRVVAGAAALVAGESARAADYPAPPPLQPVQEFASNWYIRGDVGYGVQTSSRGGSTFSGSSVTNGPTGGVGFGIKKDWFRADVTADYGGNARFHGFNPAFAPDLSARITNVTTLLNAYFDLGTWWGLTPYVGAGAGFSYFRPIELSIGQATISSNIDFAWAGNAGLAYNVSRNILIDLSYRYLDMGTSRANIAPLGTVSFGNIATQQVRLGLRYQID
jgi:opacity protein-like surface antigen